MTTKKNTHPTYTAISAPKLRQPLYRSKGKKVVYLLDYIDDGNNAHEIECTKKLYTAVEEDGLHSNYRVHFTLHKNDITNEVEYITTEAKDIYGAYEVEYEEDISLPDKDVYQLPG